MIFVEGKPDKVLFSALGFANSTIKIAGSKGAVCNLVKRKSKVKGVIDEDPGTACPTYITKLTIVSKDINLIELEDRTNASRIIIIRPYLEEWVISFCAGFNIDLQKYFLPTTSKDLKKVINYRLKRFEKLISDNREIEALQRLKIFVNK